MYTYIPISPPSCVSLPPSLSHSSRGTQSTELISLCYAAASYQLSILHLVVYICPCHSHFVPAYPSPSLCPQVNSLHLRLYSCPASRFFRTIFFFFLHSIYMCQHTVFVFLFLTYFTLYDNLGPSMLLQMALFHKFWCSFENSFIKEWVWEKS